MMIFHGWEMINSRLSINGEEVNSADDFQEEIEVIPNTGDGEQPAKTSSFSASAPLLEQQQQQTQPQQPQQHREGNENEVEKKGEETEREENQPQHPTPLKMKPKTRVERKAHRRRRFTLIQDLFPSDEEDFEEEEEDDDDDDDDDKLVSLDQEPSVSPNVSSSSSLQIIDNVHELEVMADFYATQADLALLQRSTHSFFPGRTHDEDSSIHGHPFYSPILHAMASDIAKQNYITHLPETISLSSSSSILSLQSMEEQIASDVFTSIRKEQAIREIRKVQGYEHM